MVRQCELCKKNMKLNPKLTFHRFPLNVERRKLWFALLGLEEGKALKGSAEICSDHFDASEFGYRNDGVKFLKKDALPKSNFELLDETRSSSSNSSLHFSETTISVDGSETLSASECSGSLSDVFCSIFDEEQPVIKKTMHRNMDDIEKNLPIHVLVDNWLDDRIPENDIKTEIEDHELNMQFVPEEPNISKYKPSGIVNSDSQHPIRTFFDSMTLTVMKFPPLLAVKAKMEVMKVISDLELEVLAQNTRQSQVQDV